MWLRRRGHCLAQSRNVCEIWTALLDERLQNGMGPNLEDQDPLRNVLAGLPEQDPVPVAIHLYSHPRVKILSASFWSPARQGKGSDFATHRAS